MQKFITFGINPAMARKREIKKAAQRFITEVDLLLAYTDIVSTGQSAAHQSLIFDGAVIQLYRLFEGLILETLVGAINQNMATFSAKTEVNFPKHLNDEVWSSPLELDSCVATQLRFL